MATSMTFPAARRIAIIGAGHVGATAAYALMLRALATEIVLIDADMALARSEAADLSDANALARPARIWAGDYADAAGADIAVITAGAATQGSDTRLSVAARSAAIVRTCALRLMEAGFSGVLLIAANPVDVMAWVAFEATGLPPARVIGTGTLLDSARVTQALARELEVAPASIEALVLGEHGDSEVAAFSAARIGGVALDQFPLSGGGGLGGLDRPAVATEVRKAAYGIIAGKGYTSFGIATAIVRICEVILRDERAVLPVSTLLTGQYGLTGLFLSLPCVLGAGGVRRVLTPDLDAAERLALAASAEVVRTAIEAPPPAPAVAG